MNQWFVGIKYRGEDIYDLSDLRICKASKGFYWADPFLAHHDGKDYLFMEEYDYKKGYLVVGELDGLVLKRIRIILDEPQHISFPSVNKIGEEWYMAPERCLAGELWIYKATKFPDEWTQVSLVAKGRFDDPIIKEVPGGVQVWATQDNTLVVFENMLSLQNEWRVIRREDKPFMRNAGNFIGDLRPTQDSVPVYGRAIKIMDGDKPTRSIEPTWYDGLTGTHTFNVSSKYVVTDGRIKLS